MVSDAVMIAGIGGVVSIISLTLTLLIKRGQDKQVKEISEQTSKIDEYHKEVNGRMGELLETTKTLGNIEGKADAKKPAKRKK